VAARAIVGGDMTKRVATRTIPVLIIAGTLGLAVAWTLLVDVEVMTADRQWVPQWVVFLTVLIMPLGAMLDAAVRGEPSRLWTLVAPLVGAFLVAHYYAFDTYGSPPYLRNSEAGDMPALAIYLGAGTALATGIFTGFRRRLGMLSTVIVCFGCSVLVFFSNVFH
jgi:hypothetical protein